MPWNACNRALLGDTRTDRKQWSMKRHAMAGKGKGGIKRDTLFMDKQSSRFREEQGSGSASAVPVQLGCR